MKVTNVATSPLSSSACSTPVRTSTVFGRSPWRLLTSSSGEVPPLAATEIASSLP